MATASKLMTAEEFMAADLGEGTFELVRGEVIEMPPPGPDHGRISFKAGFVLEIFGARTGFGYCVGNDSAVQTERGPDTVRGPDMAFYSSVRLPRPALTGSAPPVPPDLVIEVFSPSNTARQMREKVNEYLNAGVLMVWVLHPGRRTLAIYRPDDPVPVVLGEGEVVENLPELPGFRCAVADFFL